MLTHSVLEPGGPCTKSMEISESCRECVNVPVKDDVGVSLSKLLVVEFEVSEELGEFGVVHHRLGVLAPCPEGAEGLEFGLEICVAHLVFTNFLY